MISGIRRKVAAFALLGARVSALLIKIDPSRIAQGGLGGLLEAGGVHGRVRWKRTTDKDRSIHKKAESNFAFSKMDIILWGKNFPTKSYLGYINLEYYFSTQNI